MPAKPVVIAQISDLHCGSPFFDERLAHQVIDEVNALAPDILAVTGDLTDMGYGEQFEQAFELLQNFECTNRIELMGNHDARNVGDEHFQHYFGDRWSQVRYAGVHMLGLDSSEPDLDSGNIGRKRYEWIAEQYAHDEDEFRAVALHHHLVPVPHTGRERNIVSDAGDVLTVLQNNGVDMVISGHKHVPNVWRLEDILIVNAGTCCTGKLRGNIPPSYNVIEVGDDFAPLADVVDLSGVTAEVGATCPTCDSPRYHQVRITVKTPGGEGRSGGIYCRGEYPHASWRRVG